MSAFLQTYLENNILAPLDSPAPPPRTALNALDTDFAAHQLAAETPTERALYANASGLCNTLALVLDERERQQLSLLNIQTTGHANNSLDRPVAGVAGHYSWTTEAERARAQHRDAIQAGLKRIDKKNSYVTFNLQAWANLTGRYRQAIQQGAINVSAAQIRFDRERAAPAAAPSAEPATATAAPN